MRAAVVRVERQPCASEASCKELLEAMFLHLYNHDIIAEESFVAWKNDYEDETPGRRSAIIELTRWFQWLDSLEDEESSDEDEDDDDE